MNSHQKTDQLTRALGWGSVALGVPQAWMPDKVARVAGLDDLARAPQVVRAVGFRELGQGLTLLRGPRGALWTRVAGDVLDLGVLYGALRSRTGDRRRRTTAAIKVVLAITALDLVGVRARRRRQHGKGRPGPLRLSASTTVKKNPEEVYAFWRDFENLPTFMLHLQSVTKTGDGRWRWVANAPLRRSVTWEAEMTGDEPGRRISWRSLPGSDVDSSGTVHFAPAPDGKGTEVRVVLHYDVPGGRLGQAFAKLLGEEPEQQVRDDLRRFKQVLETADILRSDAQSYGASSTRWTSAPKW